MPIRLEAAGRLISKGMADPFVPPRYRLGPGAPAFETPSVIRSAVSGRLDGSAGHDLLSLGSGAGTINAGAGDDILTDGAGSDRLTGGAGADIFLMTADGQRDVIADITPGEDLLDLSLWPMLYGPDRLTIHSTEKGAVITYGAEELELLSDDGSTLRAADSARLMPQTLSRYVVEIGPLQESEPEPMPEKPARLPVPRPDPDPAPDPGQRSIGGAADDTITGGSGNDTLWGGAGVHLFSCGWGNDTVYGKAGDDWLAGSFDADTIDGGAGADIFAFNAHFSNGRDVIRDFTPDEDMLRLVGASLGPEEGRHDQLHLSAITVDGGSAVQLSFADHRITLLGIELPELELGDFRFS